MEPINLGHLAVWTHAPKGKAKARVLHVHGLGEHSARHTNTFEVLCNEGYEVVRFDLRGAGQSGGRRQHIESFNDYVDDTVQVFNWICSDLDPLPLYVMGHSLGGAIATFFASAFSNQIQGLMLTAPAYLAGGAFSPLKLAAARILSRVTPTLKVPKGGDMSYVSRDPKVVEDYMNDPLACHFNTVGQGNAIIQALKTMPEKAKQVHCPTVIVHGTADKIVLLEGSFTVFQALSSKDKVFHILPHFYHEPHNDLEKENFFSCLLQWLARHAEAIEAPNGKATDKQKKLKTKRLDSREKTKQV